ncbi:hypothetical protein GPLA_3819 [Paraglaciecola polaris LMG 21857]|uniref:Uncharacterized protein n=1 Tax=Paraglaciecola polaris LMG 21857 TaxID=1129793 RepID=K7AHH9_9ALTE|nr:hypothetical protein GPLA_3819 [Paraglaciecola polaris LMG 21857]
MAINYPSNWQAAQKVAQYINHIGGKVSRMKTMLSAYLMR